MLNRTNVCRVLVLFCALHTASRALADANIVIKQAPPLPPPTGTVVYVSNISNLENQITNATFGTTIMVQPGNYYSTKTLAPQAGVTIRGATGNRDDVTIWGAGMNNTSAKRNLFWLRYSDITLADLTLRDAYYHGVQIAAEYNTDRIHLYNLKILDCGERFIKGSTDNNAAHSPDDIVIEYCWLEQITPLANHSDNDYIGGIDAMWCTRWIIRDNVMKNIRGQTGGGRGGIFLWQNCRDTTIERNLVIGCDRGIAIGNPSGPAVGTYHMTNGIVRNNFIVRGADIGMELCYTNNLKAYNNTIYGSDASYFRALHVNSSVTTGLKFYSNLLRGQVLYSSGGTADTTGSIIGGSVLSSWFVEPAVGDLRLTDLATAAINKGQVLPEVTDDYFANPRDSRPDIGASEAETIQPPKIVAFTPALAQVLPKSTPLTQISFTFDKNVTINSSMVSVVGANTGPNTDFTFSYDSASFTATLQWPAAGLPNDTYIVTVSDAVTAGSTPLDGEVSLINPTLPSGDGTEGGAFRGAIYRQIGDISMDRCVNVGDLQILVAGWGKTFGEAGYDARSDLDDNNYVNIGDLQILVAYWGSLIPLAQ